MRTSEHIGEIAKALSAAQGAIKNPSKESINPHFKNHYADLSGGINAVRDALASNGLAVIQVTGMRDNVLMLTTRVCHSSGQWIEGEYPVCQFPSPPQVTGSALTYARRYTLFAMVGIAGEDDDGEQAKTAETPAPRQKFVAAAKKAFPGAKVVEDMPFTDGPDTAAQYVRDARAHMDEWSRDAVSLWNWWQSEEPHREAAGLSVGVISDLEAHMKAKVNSIRAKST